MERRTVFISSCTRRQLWRRRPGPYWLRAIGGQTLVAVAAFAAALGALLAARGGM